MPKLNKKLIMFSKFFETQPEEPEINAQQELLFIPSFLDIKIARYHCSVSFHNLGQFQIDLGHF